MSAAQASKAADKNLPQKVEDVIVLGSHSRALQRESLAVTAFSKAQIERAGITAPSDFLRLTPGVSFIQGISQSDSQISIRGISQTYNESVDAPVGVIVDGIPLTSPNDFNQSLYDLQSIEVLKGPQNAVYGRNAVAGAVVIDTALPPSKFTASSKTTVTNGDGYGEVLMVGGPLIRNIANASLVLSEDYLGGFYKNITTGNEAIFHNNKSVTGRIFLTPTPDLAIDLKVGYVDLYGNANEFYSQASYNPFYKGIVPDANNVNTPYVSDLPAIDRTLKNNASMRVDYQLPFGEISSISSYTFNKDNYNGALFPYLPAAIGASDGIQHELYSNLSYFQELKFSSRKSRRLRYQFGADYYDFKRLNVTSNGYTLDHIEYDAPGPYPLGGDEVTTSYQNDIIHTRTWELFGQAAYDVTHYLTIDGAIRYSRDDITDLDQTPPAFTTTPGLLRSGAYSKAEPKATLTYRATPSLSFYASWALGFLPGGFNQAGSSAIIHAASPKTVATDTYDPETSRNAEIGFKSQWFDKRLTVNGSAYYDLVTNQQYNQYFAAANILTISSINKVRIFGGELEADLVPLPGWLISVGAGLVDAKIESFSADPAAIGNRPPYTPDYNLNFALQKSFKINESLNGYARFDDSVRGTQYFEADNVPGGRINVLNLANMRIGLNYGRWNVAIFAKNIADNRYNAQFGLLTNTAVFANLALPRVYGGEITVRF